MKRIQNLCDEFEISADQLLSWAGMGLLIDIDITEKAGRLSESQYKRDIENFIYNDMIRGDNNED